MSKIFVSGLTNVETSCSVNHFPIAYKPIDYNFFGINSVASGVGLNVSLALDTLGDEVSLASFVGGDEAGDIVRKATASINDCRFASCEQTPQSVVLYDKSGRRNVFTDLKNVQDLSLPESCYEDLDSFDGFCLCNIEYSRPILARAKRTGKPIFCDVHCLSNIYDEYNADFMRYADVLFLSNENITGMEENFVIALTNVYPCKVVVVGMSAQGALLYERDKEQFTMISPVMMRPVVNTVGAGDALYSAYVHFSLQGDAPEVALKKARCFASYKIGESGASKGFLSEEALLAMVPDV